MASIETEIMEILANRVTEQTDERPSATYLGTPNEHFAELAAYVRSKLRELGEEIKNMAGDPFPGELPNIQDAYFKQEVDAAVERLVGKDGDAN